MYSKRSKRLFGIKVSTIFILVALLTFSLVGIALAGPVGNAAGFEDDDGNLAVNSTFDWNSFATVSWKPSPSTTPTRHAEKSVNGFNFLGLEDWQATTADSGFAGGTKQDDNCPTVITAKADNKADLKRIYVSSKNVGGEIYLFLGWVRIPQNTTSPSAHIAFEFNQGTTACGASSGGLVQRSVDDMLIVYDFEGGSTDVPHITLRKWIDTGTCEISNDAPPCWGTATDLTNLGFAEAKVNTFGSVPDLLAPPALSSTTGNSVSATLGTNEFGEAGLDLGPNGANIFPADRCVSFGKVFGVSRTSGNSGTAQMKDLVGPGDFRLSNCGTIKIIKHTNPRGIDQNFSYSTTGGLVPDTFTLNDKGNTTADSTDNTKTYSNVFAGDYTVTEGTDPTGFVFESLTCTSNGSGTSATTSGKTASITLAGDGSVTCTYVNKQQLGAIQVKKTSVKTNNPVLAGAEFSIGGQTYTTDANGLACVDNLPFGDYIVKETKAPTGYAIDDATEHTVTVNNNAKCSDDPFVGEVLTFTDTPLTNLKITVWSQVAGGTKSIISCVDSSQVDIGSEPTYKETAEVTANDLKPGTYTCTVVIDP